MKKSVKGSIAVLAGNTIFGFSFLFSKIALQITEPVILIAVRFTVAFLLLNVVVLFGKKLKDKEGKPLLQFSLKGKPKKDILLLALFEPIIYFAAENYGMVYTSSAFAGIIIAMIPLAGIVCDVLFMHAKADKVHIICAFCSVIGVALTAMGAADMSSSLVGLMFLLVAVTVAALFYVYSKRSGSYYSALERTYVMFALGSVSYILLAVVRCCMVGSQILLNAVYEPSFWLSILYLSCISSVLAYLLLNYGSSYISVSNASLYANVTTVISIVAGVVFLKESLTWTQVIGAVIIILSVYCSQMIPARKKTVER